MRAGLKIIGLLFFLLIFFSWLKKPVLTKQQLLSSFYQNLNLYETAFAKVKKKPQQKISAGIISHHFLAKDLIAEFFIGIDPQGVKNIFILGPDHFQSLASQEADLVTSNLDWQTPYGVLPANRQLINSLNKNLKFKINNHIFKNEHSVYTLVPFAKKVFPQAKVIPLVIKSSTDYKQAFAWGKQVYKRDSILIISSDFSHQATLEQAQANDQQSIQALISQDLSQINHIESDCKPCMAFLYGFISQVPSKFKLIANQTAADFGSQDEQNLTSYLSVYFLTPNFLIL